MPKTHETRVTTPQPDEHATKEGHPDRRFKGQRDLSPPEENPDYVQPRQGGVVDGEHVTLDGKPDHRFKENRGEEPISVKSHR